jgi:hypothetical protein
VKNINSFLREYGLPSLEDDQGAASPDLLGFADAIAVSFDDFD